MGGQYRIWWVSRYSCYLLWELQSICDPIRIDCWFQVRIIFFQTFFITLFPVFVIRRLFKWVLTVLFSVRVVHFHWMENALLLIWPQWLNAMTSITGIFLLGEREYRPFFSFDTCNHDPQPSITHKMSFHWQFSMGVGEGTITSRVIENEVRKSAKFEFNALFRKLWHSI